jgi:hypothetical protein
MGKIKGAIFVLLFLAVLIPEVNASIVLKVIAVNPSKEEEQAVTVKAYLPKEAKPEDILDKGDLDSAYDTQQGSYFVFGEYTLKPGEVLERNIELRDIWVIQDAEIESIRLEAGKINSVLKNTEFGERASFLIDSIEAKLNQIRERQKTPPANPERHISEYRDDMKLLESIKTDLALARSFMAQAKAMPSFSVWKVIIAIIIFLGLLGLSFYFIWHRQVKAITIDDTFFVPKEDQKEPEAAPARHEAEEKKTKETDVGKILGEEKEEA